MSDWLKTDPKNGMLIGPNGCHYDNEHQAMHFAVLGLCGCGDSVGAYNFCRDALAAFDRRLYIRTGDREHYADAEKNLCQMITASPDMAAHVLAHLFAHLGLLEHGTSVSGSWLTADGERIVDHEPMTDKLRFPEQTP